jgi:GNAT superfamily N-acetyltransferase
MTATHKFHIRPLLPTDRHRWDPLWQGYLSFYEQSLSAEVTDCTFSRLTITGPHRGMVAERGAELVGLVHYLFHDRTWSLKPICYLEDLYVDPVARGDGIGTALIQAVYAAADAAGSSTVYWQTQVNNATARRVYDRIGRLSEFVRYDRPDGTP